jgi:hypothetical protein
LQLKLWIDLPVPVCFGVMAEEHMTYLLEQELKLASQLNQFDLLVCGKAHSLIDLFVSSRYRLLAGGDPNQPGNK